MRGAVSSSRGKEITQMNQSQHPQICGVRRSEMFCFPSSPSPPLMRDQRFQNGSRGAKYAFKKCMFISTLYIIFISGASQPSFGLNLAAKGRSLIRLSLILSGRSGLSYCLWSLGTRLVFDMTFICMPEVRSLCPIAALAKSDPSVTPTT